MKQFSANHYQKTERHEKPANLFKIAKKYLRKDIAIPHLILTRIERPPSMEWEVYYHEFQTSFRDLHAALPKNTAVFLNCQLDPNIQILSPGQPLKSASAIRNPCFVLAV